VRLVADANVLLASLIGGKAKQVLRHPEVTEILTTTGVVEEITEYVPILARKKRLSLDILLAAAASLPVTVVDRNEYEHAIPKAEKRIAARDPDDVELLALALHSDVAVWSNDDDFEDGGVDWYTTAELLAKLQVT
jgi:predicted nucleic acid-binding protein